MTSGSDPFVHLEQAGPVMVITLERHERHNSLIPDLLAQLISALGNVGEDPATRAVVSAGSRTLLLNWW